MTTLRKASDSRARPRTASSVADEPTREFLREHSDRVSSALALAEVPRASRRARVGAAARRRVREILARVALVDIDRRALAAAAVIDPPSVRTCDAIHLATALALREDLSALVTYDRRLAVAAARADLHV